MAPKSKGWAVAFSASLAAAVAIFAAARWLGPVEGSRGAGLGFGIAAALLMLASMALSLRKRFKAAYALGRTMQWLQLHLYAGTLAFILVLMHTGFGLPDGPQGWALFILTLTVSLTGLAGAWLQKWIPHALSRGVQVEAIYERIPELIVHLRSEADAIVLGASRILQDFHRQELAAILARPQPSLVFLLDTSGGRGSKYAVFSHVAPRLAAEEKEKLDDLRQILTEKNGLDAQLSLQRILRLWLYVHVPASSALMALILIHAGAWLVYG